MGPTILLPGGKLTLNEDYNERWGLRSSLFAECSKCKRRTFFRTSYGDKTKNDTHQANDINRRMAFATCETGLSKAGLETICEILNMPGPPEHMNEHYQELLRIHRNVADRVCQEARAKLRALLLKQKGLPINDEDTVLDACVNFDGSWPKMGFTSKNGVGYVISPDTGEVLDYSIKSNYCNKCKYDNEKAETCHECRKNYEGSSPSMERACARELWQNSLTNGANLRYTGMI